MVVAHQRQSVRRHNLTSESLFHFAKLEDEAYRARRRHITTNVAKKNREEIILKPTWVRFELYHVRNEP